MAIDDSKQWGQVHRNLPALVQNTQTGPVRINHRGDQVVQAIGKPVYGLVDQGAYYIARSPTPGTGVASIVAADAYDDLETFLFLRNSATDGTGSRIYLDYLTIRVTVAGSSGSTTNFFSKIDNGNSRYTSGGVAVVPTNCNMESSSSASVAMYSGALITGAATTSARLLSARQIRPVIAVAGDVYEFDFGAPNRQIKNVADVAGTAVCNQYFGCAPVVLGPEDQWCFGLWGTSQAGAAQYEFELAFWEY
jgi:hypothetical protein